MRAAHVDGDTARPAQDAALAALRDGRLDVVTSVGTLSEGFDEPAVSCVVLLRPTHSRGLYIQQVGAIPATPAGLVAGAPPWCCL